MMRGTSSGTKFGLMASLPWPRRGLRWGGATSRDQEPWKVRSEIVGSEGDCAIGLFQRLGFVIGIGLGPPVHVVSVIRVIYKRCPPIVARLASSLGYELVKAEAEKGVRSNNPDVIDLTRCMAGL